MGTMGHKRETTPIPGNEGIVMRGICEVPRRIRASGPPWQGIASCESAAGSDLEASPKRRRVFLDLCIIGVVGLNHASGVLESIRPALGKYFSSQAGLSVKSPPARDWACLPRATDPQGSSKTSVPTCIGTVRTKPFVVLGSSD